MRVFTQPGSKGDIGGRLEHVCLPLQSGHSAAATSPWSLRNRSQGPSESVSFCGDRATAAIDTSTRKSVAAVTGAAVPPTRYAIRASAGGVANSSCMRRRHVIRTRALWRSIMPAAFTPASSKQTRQQHRHPLAIAPVFIAEQRHQIALLEIDADEDVGRRHRSEQ